MLTPFKTPSPHFWYRKCIRATNENLNFDMNGSSVFFFSNNSNIKILARPSPFFDPTSHQPYTQKSVFTWRHSGHVGVPNQSSGSWSLFLCKRFLLFQWICIDAGHISENVLLNSFLFWALTIPQTFYVAWWIFAVKHVTGRSKFKRVEQFCWL